MVNREQNTNKKKRDKVNLNALKNNKLKSSCRALLIFCLKIPFGELFSKIIILSSSAFLFLKKKSKV